MKKQQNLDGTFLKKKSETFPGILDMLVTPCSALKNFNKIFKNAREG
jgi:hypothetical protein